MDIEEGHNQFLGVFNIGKIQSLKVKIYQYSPSNDNPGIKTTYWCPAFKDGSIVMSNIKFYNEKNGQKELIEGSCTTNNQKSYRMQDLANSELSTADKIMNAKYFAICKSGFTLECFQTTDAAFTEAFGNCDNNRVDLPFIDSFYTVNDEPRIQDINGNQIYAEGIYTSKYFEDWISMNTPPRLNDVPYPGWYYIYGTCYGGLISCFSDAVAIPWLCASSYPWFWADFIEYEDWYCSEYLKKDQAAFAFLLYYSFSSN